MTPDLSLRAGKIMIGKLVAYIAMPFFFKTAILASPNACKDPDVQKALVSALANSEWTADATTLAQNNCFNDVRPGLEAELKKGDAKIVKNACPIPGEQEGREPRLQVVTGRTGSRRRSARPERRQRAHPGTTG